jgi:hypothetical protein
MNDIAIYWKKITRGLANGSSGLMIALQTSMKYVGYVNIQIETSEIAAFPGSFLFLSAKTQQMNGLIIIWRLLL